jgi:molybdate transport system regulatory protein
MSRLPPHLADALGHDTSDKRLDILRRVGEAGSISQAARGAGVSYKAAWQAVETLSNLAGAPLVERAVGGAGGGGARLTEAGQQLLQLAQRLQAAREQVLRSALGHDAGSASLLGAVALRTSMRNQLPCRVQQLRRVGGAVRVSLVVSEGQHLASRITRESAELLDLRLGQTVLALCKATAVRISALPAEVAAGLNQLSGQVSRGAPAARGGELSLSLAGGLQMVGLAAPGQGLPRGAAAWACFEESSVVLALGA